jgi:hypothetical protein
VDNLKGLIMQTHLHKAPTYRHPITKARAMIFPVWGTDNFYLDVFPYKSKSGKLVCEGHRSECIEWLKSNGYNA